MRLLPHLSSVLILLTASTALASTLNVAESGTFASGTPTSSISAAGDTWSVSFDVNSEPAVSGVSVGNYFNVAYSDFSYLLNGSAVSTPVGSITFFSDAQAGLYTLCFVSPCPGTSDPGEGLVVEGPQLYSGSESSPTILPGSYTPSDAFLSLGANTYSFGSASDVHVTEVTPEPSSLALLGTGLLGVVGVARRRLRTEAGGSAS